MRKYILSTAILFVTSMLLAQSPALFNYQGVARDAQNQVLSNQNIGLKISILDGSSTGNAVYVEEHSINTSDLGVFSLQIGTGFNQSTSLSNLSWNNGNYWVQIEMDDSGGSNYQLMGASQLVSVPFALHAQTVTNANDADADPSNEIQTISKNGNTVSLSNNGGSFTDAVDDADADATNEIQTLGFDVSSNMLSLSNGGQVDLSNLDNDGGGGMGSGTDDQVLSLSGTMLSIEDGNAVDLSVLQDGTQDADADASNELQTISKVGNLVTLSENGGSFIDAVDDADADASNEIQTIAKNGNTVTLSSNGGSFVDAVDDADSDEFNEIQFITKNGNTIELSHGGGIIIDEVDDADADASNEIQSLSLQNNILSLSQSNGQVDLGTISSPWKRVASSNEIEYKHSDAIVTIDNDSGGKIGIGYGGVSASSSTDNYTRFSEAGLDFVEGTMVSPDLILYLPVTHFTKDSLTFDFRNEGGLQSAFTSLGRDLLSMKNQIGGQANSSCFSSYNLCFDQALGDFKTSMFMDHENVEFSNINPGSNIITKVGLDSIYMTSQIGLLLPEEVTLKPFELSFKSLFSESYLSSNGLTVKEALSDSDIFNRIELVPDYFAMYNGTKWKTNTLGKNANNSSGELTLFDGVGDRALTYIGADDVGGSYMEMNSGDNLRVGFWSFQDYGLINTQGGNGFQNTYIGSANLHGNTNFGGMGVMDDIGFTQAGLEVTQDGKGLLYGDAVHIGPESELDTKFSLNLVQNESYGLNLVKEDLSTHWEIFVGANDGLGLYNNSIGMGSFDPVTGAYVNFSDKRLKSNIKDIDGVLPKIMKLNPSSYIVKNNNPGNRSSIGFIAQDVKEVFPKLVHESFDNRNKGFLSLDYSGFSVLAIKAIQEQQDIIEGQQTKINDLESRLAKIESLLNK